MDFRKYILEADRMMSGPVTGDDFDFQVNESLSIECAVVEHTDDSYTVEVDEAAWNMLKEMDLVSEAESCMECGMGTMYVVGESKMRCDECGYTMTVEAAPVHLERAREAGIDVKRDDLGDGYFLGHYVHDDGDATKVTYNVYHLENPEGLTNQLANAFRDVGNLSVSPYRAKPEEIKAAAARLKIQDQMNKKIKSVESVTEAGDASYNKYIIPNLDVLIQAMEKGLAADPRIGWYKAASSWLSQTYKQHRVDVQSLNNAIKASGIGYTADSQLIRNDGSQLLSYLEDLKRKSNESVNEAEYQGRQVTLGKPSAGDVKKYKVYVRDPKTGNTKKVNFGDKKMSIKRDNPSRRKNFRARHNCAKKKDRTTAGYWSCRMWSKKPVSKILKGK
jgi:ribosomal protein S27AE